jgi:MYXO-CTERM domain-containing protein
MRRSILLALISLLLAVPALAGTSQHGIINGEQIDEGDFESAVALILTSDMGMGATTGVSCTGTLIAPDVVMTAAHCVDPLALGMGFFEVPILAVCISFQADLGYMQDEEYQGQPPLPDDAVCAAGWLKHELFDINEIQQGGVDGPGDYHDIGLVFLEEAVEGVQHAYLPTEDEADEIVEDLVVDIVGYGQRDPDLGMFDMFPPLRYWAETFINEVGDFEMQIGADGEDGRKCHGDSGGPTYADIGLGPVAERVIGVTSHAYNTTDDCYIGGVDTRADAHLDWIDEHMRAACEDDIRVECDEPGIIWAPEDDGDDDDATVDDDDDDGGGQGCQDCRSTVVGSGPTGLLALLAMSLFGLLRRRS